jgi:hypothetical protein
MPQAAKGVKNLDAADQARYGLQDDPEQQSLEL